jgi:hypothetical protein
MRLQVERDLLIGADVGETFVEGVPASGATSAARPRPVDWVIAAVVLTALGVDLGLALIERFGRSRR